MAIDHSLFDSLLEPVFILSADGKVVYCNETAALICETSARKIQRGMFFKDLLVFQDSLEWMNELDKVVSPVPYKETNFTTHGGQHGKVQITVQPLEANLWIVFARDVTLEERLQQKYRAELGQKEDVILELQRAQAELEKYSKNLEKMVQERTQEISRMNRLMKALLDSLGQGFFIFDASGLCLEVASKACEATVEQSPAGKMIWDVLKLPENKVPGFQRWMSTAFSEMLPFADLGALGPASYPHSAGQNISLEYFPLRTDENQIDGIVVVATDITNLVEAQKQAKIEKQHSEMILSLVRSKNQVSRFIRESEEMMNELNALLKKDLNGEAVFRCLHTLKGGAGMLSILEMTEACHEAETLLSDYNAAPTPEAAQKLRLKCAVVAESFNKFQVEAKEVLGSSVLTNERLLELSVSHVKKLFEKFDAVPAAKPIAKDILASLIQEPIETFFLPYKETARKLATAQNKVLAEVKFVNGNLSVTPEVYGSLFATFVHAYRNAVDHGIETPEERVSQGKPESATLTTVFEFVDGGSHLRISLSDDGRGIDPEKIRSRLISKRPDSAAKWRAENDEQIIQHVFDSQFSTKETVTAISGRGVGLDAIKSEATSLGGTAWVTSSAGLGSTIVVEVPLLTSLQKAA